MILFLYYISLNLVKLIDILNISNMPYSILAIRVLSANIPLSVTQKQVKQVKQKTSTT